MFKFKIISKMTITGILVASSSIATANNVSLSTEETRLYELVNKYRAENGLSAIPLSSSLTYVAQTHVRDLQNYPPSGNCNAHSWSSNGAWSSCCYTPDHAQSQCMWDKPRELTNYPGRGYENAHGGSNGYQVTATSAIEGWKRSHGHNAVILNQGTWSKHRWNALGVGIYKGYAVLWFGQEIDPVQMTSTIGITTEAKSNAIFNQIEQLYADLFFPATITQINGTGQETVYYRVYNNLYQAALATIQGDLWYAFYNEWNRFSTLEEANQIFCNNQCWANTVNSNPTLTTGAGGRIKKTENTFVDTHTGLEWVADEIINLERNEAIAYCNNLNYAGHQDWRLSTSNELSNFVKALDQSSVKPNYLGSFSGCLAGITSDGYIALTSKHVPFGEPINFIGHAAVRCVR